MQEWLVINWGKGWLFVFEGCFFLFITEVDDKSRKVQTKLILKSVVRATLKD